MKLETTMWKEFRISDLFDVSVSKDNNLFNSGVGRTPFVASSSANNGVTGYVDVEPSQNANTITIARNGSVGSTFYQPIAYCASPDDIRILTPKFALNSRIGLFICTVIQQEKFKYSYGRKLSTERIKKLIVKLPVDNKGLPNWSFMEQYVNTLHHKPITTKIPKTYSPPDTNEWGEYTLGELFRFHKGKRLTKEDMTEGTVNFIGAIRENNGVRQFIDVEPMFEPNCITVNYNGSVGEAFYQFEPFWASDDVNVLYADGWELNKHIAMFIITVIKANRYKFSYGRKWTLEKMKESVIKLPKSHDGSPDFDYMEQYIKSLPYSDRI